MKIGKKIISGIEDYIIADILSDGYEDITSVKNWIEIGDLLFKDFKFIRKRLQEMDFNSLSNDEKIQVCQYKGSSEENNKQYLLGDSFNFWMTDFDLKSQKCRNERFSLTKTILIKNVSIPDRYAILGFLNTTQLENNYIKFGIEGIESQDPISGIFDFVQATNNYSLSGIAVMNLTMLNGTTKEQMIEAMMNALRNGTY